MLETIKKFKSVFLILGILGTIVSPKVSYAYPVFAQNAYQNPREATGRIYWRATFAPHDTLSQTH